MRSQHHRKEGPHPPSETLQTLLILWLSYTEKRFERLGTSECCNDGRALRPPLMANVRDDQTDDVVHAVEPVQIRVLAHFAFEMGYAHLNLRCL